MSAVLELPFNHIPKPKEVLANGGNIDFVPEKKSPTSTMSNLSTEDLQEILRGVLTEQKKSSVIQIPQWFAVGFTIPIILLIVWFVQWRSDTNNQLDIQKARITSLEEAKKTREDDDRAKFREEMKQAVIDAAKKGEERGYAIRQVDGHNK